MNKLVDAIRSEDIIREVKKKHVLWDTSHTQYLDKDERTNAWVSILNRFFPSCQEYGDGERFEMEAALRKRWKNIRTCYSRELHKRNTQGGVFRRKVYRHFETLSFLDKNVKTVPPANEVIENSPKEIVPKKPSLANGTVQRVVKKTAIKKRKIEEKIESETLKKKILGEATIPRHQKEADVLFLMSLVPDFQKVPESRKMQLKLEILTAISKAHQPLPSGSQPQPVEVWQHQSPPGEFHLTPGSEDQEDLLSFQEVMVSAESPTFVKMEAPESTSEEERSAEDSEIEEDFVL